MLSLIAKQTALVDQAGDMYQELQNRICWSRIPAHYRGQFVEDKLVSRLSERWPLVAEVDAKNGGLLTNVLRAFASNPKIPAWWMSPIVALKNARPDAFESSCKRVLEHCNEVEPEAFSEEKPDPILRQAARHWSDRDELDDVLLET